jgi:NADPH2:quinone reductase
MGCSAESAALPFWPMLFDNVIVRLLGSDDFPVEAKQQAATDLTAAAAAGAVVVSQYAKIPLEQIAAGHDLVDQGMRGRALIDVDSE